MTTATADYEPRTAVQVAKIVRAEIKAAVAAGELPDVRYYVRSDTFAGGQSVNVHMMMDEDRAWEPTTPTDVEFLQYHMDIKLTAEVRAAGERLHAICRPHRSGHFYVSPYLNGGTCI